MKSSVVVSLLLVLTLAAGSAVAEEKGGFWDGLLKKINNIASHGPQGRGKAYTSVVGIRGAETDAGSDSLYWKGQAQPVEEDADLVVEAELAAFRQAVSYAVEGDTPQAMTAFKTFTETYPESQFHSDAVAAMDRLNSETPQTDAPETAPQTAPAAN